MLLEIVESIQVVRSPAIIRVAPLGGAMSGGATDEDMTLLPPLPLP